MRISRIKIENLQVFKSIVIPVDNYTCIIGANGSGKSTILHALNIFFHEESEARTNVTLLTEDDFQNKDTSNPIQITLTFVDLSDQAQRDFKDYYRHGELVVCAKASYDKESRTAKVAHHGYRNVMADFTPYFQAAKEGTKVDELGSIYNTLRKSYSDLPNVSTKKDMGPSLQTYESEHPDLCTLQPSEDLFYGVSRAADKFDNYLQWIFIPAIKHVHPEQTETGNTALKKLLLRTVRAHINFTEEISAIREQATSRYKNVLVDKRDALDLLSKELTSKLQYWAHPDTDMRLKWQLPDKTIQIPNPIAEVITREGLFEGRLERFGHGLQRCYLFALLHVLSTCDDTYNPTLILGCEEPELFQHPPQLRHLSEVFKKLADDNSQIFLSTHSPHFVAGQDIQAVRLVRKDITTCTSQVSFVRIEQITDTLNNAYSNRPPEPIPGTLIKIHQTLQPELNELFFSNTVVLVEGHEDNAFISTYLHLMGWWEDFRKLGCHIVPAGGKSNLVRIVAIAKNMNLSYYVIFDSDGNESNPDNREKHEKDNLALHCLLNNDNAIPFPSYSIVADQYSTWKTEIMNDISEELTPQRFNPFLDAARNKYGNPGGIEKHYLYIAEALQSAWNNNLRSCTLQGICNSIIAKAEQTN